MRKDLCTAVLLSAMRPVYVSASIIGQNSASKSWTCIGTAMRVEYKKYDDALGGTCAAAPPVMKEMTEREYWNAAVDQRKADKKRSKT